MINMLQTGQLRLTVGAVSRLQSNNSALCDDMNINASPIVSLAMRQRLESVSVEIRRWAAKSVCFDFDASGTDLFSMQELDFSYAKRADDLVNSINLLLSAGRIMPAVVCARALIETVAMGCFYIKRMSAAIEAKDGEHLRRDLERFYAGTKDGSIQPFHVMDALRYLEKIDKRYVKYLSERFGFFFPLLRATHNVHDVEPPEKAEDAFSMVQTYAELSEFAHPNGAGTQMMYPDEGSKNKQYYTFHERCIFSSQAAIWQINYLVRKLESWNDVATKYRDLFMK